MTRIKICGITRPQDAVAAARLGADALGLVFHARSSRHVSPDQAAAITQALPPFVTAVALFLDANEDEVRAVLRVVPVDLLQFHGSEPPGYCRQFGRPYLKAIGMGAGAAVATALAARYPDAAGLLLDSHPPGAAGGTGEAFAWQALPVLSRPVVLAGGLTPGNVAAAIAAAHPWAVDVSSGVESAPGIKDEGKMAAFIQEARRAG
jgi:phosphoribosylanthranilate isomerase